MPLLLLHGERRMTRQLDKQLYGFLDTPVLRATLFVDNLLADVVRLGVKLETGQNVEALLIRNENQKRSLD